MPTRKLCSSSSRPGKRRRMRGRKFVRLRNNRAEMSSPGLTGRPRADSVGRRNTSCMAYSEKFVESFRRRFPTKGFSGPGVECKGHGLKVIGAMCAEIGALWKVLAQQPVGVLVGAALPRAVRITEVDLHVRVDFQTSVLSQLSALIPGQRPTQLLRHGADRAGNGVAHCLGAMPCQCGSFLHANFLFMACHARQMQQDGET